MNDWRYDSLRDDIKRLRDELNAVKRRTWEVERWQDRVPFRIELAVCWLVMVCVWAAVIADAAGAF